MIQNIAQLNELFALYIGQVQEESHQADRYHDTHGDGDFQGHSDVHTDYVDSKGKL